MKVLFIGDIVGRGGRAAVAKLLPSLRTELQLDFVIANGENAASGFGLTEKVYNELLDLGINVLTSGNHIWDKREFVKDFDSYPCIIRPANYPEQGVPGRGYDIFEVVNKRLAVINLLGRVFINNELDSPFVKAKQLVEQLKGNVDHIIVDIHAETTSEKRALANYLDSQVSAVIGTHTHVQTADERLLAGGTAFISDAGMVGAVDSLLGMEPQPIINKFLNAMPQRFKPVVDGQMLFNGVFLDLAAEKFKVNSISRIREEVYVKTSKKG